MYLDLQPNETEIRGEWLDTGGKVVGDAACDRIEWLVKLRLERLASDATGWETLYRDPSSGRLWEHTHPHGEYHGGGPPMLRAISASDVKLKYGIPLLLPQTQIQQQQ
jgi:hypothetical protein